MVPPRRSARSVITVADDDDPWRPSWMPRLIAAFVGATIVCILLFFLRGGPAGGLHGGIPWFVLSHLLSFLAFSYGSSTARRGFRGDWNLALMAITVWVVGDLTGSAVLGDDGTPALWQLGVVMSVVAFTLMTVAVWRLARRDGYVQGASIALDAAIYGLGTVLIWWTLVGQELVLDTAFVDPFQLFAALIPLGDGILLAATATLMGSRSAHALSSRALVVMCVAGLAGDLGFARHTLGLLPGLDAWVPACWMLQFAAAAVAALASGRASVLPDHRLSPAAAYLAMACLVTGPLVALFAGSGRVARLHLHRPTALLVIAGTLVLAVLLAQRERGQLQRITAQAEEMKRNARTDHLTQLPNRRAGERILGSAISAVRSSGTGVLAVGILDIDRFKLYNDSYGHQQGDQLLRACALSWSSVIAGMGTIFRYGGEEFVVVMPQTTQAEAEQILEAMRRATPRGQSFSAGLAMLTPDDDADTLVARADGVLYAAKEGGRARTVCA